MKFSDFSDIFLKFDKWGGWNFKKPVNIGNEWKERHECWYNIDAQS